MEDEIMSVQKETVKSINDSLSELAKQMGHDRADNYCPWIVFSIDDTEYAINATYTLSVAILYEVIPYVEAPAYCPGVIWDYKGIIRLLDLRILLGQGNYLSHIKKGKSGIPMIIIIEPDGKRRGMIVDRIAVPEYVNASIEASVNEGHTQSRYIKGLIKYGSQKIPALVISPESISILEFENQDAKIDWKGRIDIEMKIDGHKYSPE